MKTRTLISTTILILSFINPGLSYDEYQDSLPNWEERAVLVYTNACRMAPITFRDRYIGNSSILLPENYPPVAPLYRDNTLGRAARFHTIQMARDCGMSHTCNGQTFDERIRSFYTEGGYIGENIAAGYRTPQMVVNGWIIDGRSAQTAAPDGNGDGHRANIMNDRFKKIGFGYFITGSGRTAKPYWCQDFGSKQSEFSHQPIAAASHLFLSEDDISFWANVVDPAGTITAIHLILDDKRFRMNLDLGSPAAGTYTITLPEASSCRYYRIEATYTTGDSRYYPETGQLPTTGEGYCKEVEPNKTTAIPAPIQQKFTSLIGMNVTHSGFIFTSSPSINTEVISSIYTANGVRLLTCKWNRHSPILHLSHFSPGVLIIRHQPWAGIVITQTIPLQFH